MTCSNSEFEPGTGGRLLSGLVRRRQQLPPPELRQTFVALREHHLPPPD
ncbi:hypothetical protein [Streptomyces sp. NPDC058011]